MNFVKLNDMNLGEIVELIFSHIIEIVVILVLFTIMGYVYTMNFVSPQYTSSTTLILVSQPKENGGTGTDVEAITSSDISLNSQLVSTYGEIIKSKSVLKKVKDNLGLDVSEDYLKRKIVVNAIQNSGILKISVTFNSAQGAEKIANEIAKAFIEKSEELYRIDNVKVLDEAEINETPSNINHKKDILIFAGIGGCISILYIWLIYVLDTTIKATDDLERKYKFPVLASVPLYTDGTTKKKGDIHFGGNELIVTNNPKSPISEVIRTLRTNIQFMNEQGKLKTILVTSTMPNEGKSWVASNLAVTFAQAGKIVVLIDSDMRKGRIHNIFKVSKFLGLSNYLSGVNEYRKIDPVPGTNANNEPSYEEEDNGTGLTKYLKNTSIDNLYILPAGMVPPNPSELLGTEKMVDLLNSLKEFCDIIIIDGTPCKLVTDSLILTRLVDSTVIVAADKKTKKEDFAQIVNNIKKVGGKIAGIVVNKTNTSSHKYNDTYYYYGKDLRHNKKH